MEIRNELEKEIEFLSRNIVTIWHDYDYNEKTSEIERRVPKIDIRVQGAKVAQKKVYANNESKTCNGNEEYIREYEIKYNEHTYIFRIIASVKNGIVYRFSLEVLIPQDDGLCSVLKESL